MNDKLEAAKSWLGGRWLLAKPQNKLPKPRCHVHTSTDQNRWAQVNHQIARVLEGSTHV